MSDEPDLREAIADSNQNTTTMTMKTASSRFTWLKVSEDYIEDHYWR